MKIDLKDEKYVKIQSSSRILEKKSRQDFFMKEKKKSQHK